MSDLDPTALRAAADLLKSKRYHIYSSNSIGWMALDTIDGAARVLRAEADKIERTKPVPADELEALAKIISNSVMEDFAGSRNEADREGAHVARDVIAAGFRRQGPTTDDTEWEWFEFEALAGQIDNLERSGPAALPVFFQRTRRIRDRAEAVRATLKAANAERGSAR